LPELRAEIDISVEGQGAERVVVLRDPFGIAEDAIAVQPELLNLLEHCDGITQVRATTELASFLDGVSNLGFFNDTHYLRRQQAVQSAWDIAHFRPMSCAGSSYPSEALDCLELIESFGSQTTLALPTRQQIAEWTNSPLPWLLCPHIDFRVVAGTYAAAFRYMQQVATGTRVFVLATSHYGYQADVMLSSKPQQTPFGIMPVHQQSVCTIQQLLGSHANCDHLAHKPEHSIELPLVLLAAAKRHELASSTIDVVPMLIGDAQPNEEKFARFETLAKAIATVVVDTLDQGVAAMILVSGDACHVGLRFGHDQPAEAMLATMEENDRHLAQKIAGAEAHQYHTWVQRNHNQDNICGYAPTTVALLVRQYVLESLGAAASAGQQGTITRDCWHDKPTGSAVSCLTAAL
jgi:AmmeMemoRadiSam system protein B